MRKFKGTKKCTYCGTELTQDDIKEYIIIMIKLIF